MSETLTRRTERRRLLRAAGLLPLAAAASLAVPPAARAEPTPECRDRDDPTPRQTEGPFFTPRSPRRTSLVEPGTRGERLVLAGVVLSTRCRPVAGALLDFWHCDAEGEYDNLGYRLRGHQSSDANGRNRLETLLPGLYPGRTRHIHVKVQAPARPVLTTQLYFPGEPANRGDALFRRELALRAAGRGEARFDFVLELG
jgi:protocatechuate 3,4-dioxygenase beta subunit